MPRDNRCMYIAHICFMFVVTYQAYHCSAPSYLCDLIIPFKSTHSL